MKSITGREWRLFATVWIACVMACGVLAAERPSGGMALDYLAAVPLPAEAWDRQVPPPVEEDYPITRNPPIGPDPVMEGTPVKAVKHGGAGVTRAETSGSSGSWSGSSAGSAGSCASGNCAPAMGSQRGYSRQPVARRLFPLFRRW